MGARCEWMYIIHVAQGQSWPDLIFMKRISEVIFCSARMPTDTANMDLKQYIFCTLTNVLTRWKVDTSTISWKGCWYRRTGLRKKETTEIQKGRGTTFNSIFKCLIYKWCSWSWRAKNGLTNKCLINLYDVIAVQSLSVIAVQWYHIRRVMRTCLTVSCLVIAL